MARKKLVPKVLTILNARVNGLKAIDTNLVLHNGLSVVVGSDIHTALQAATDDYNITLSLGDEKRHHVKLLEKQAQEFAKKTFDAVKSQYGDDSLEYEKVGGTRRSMRSKPVPKALKAAKAAEAAIKKAAKLAALTPEKPV